MWKFHNKLLAENRSIKPAANKKVTKASNLKVGQLVFIRTIKMVLSIFHVLDHRVAGIVNGSMVILTIPDGKEKRCNINHIKLTTALEASTGALKQFQESIQKNPGNTSPNHTYNLHSIAV